MYDTEQKILNKLILKLNILKTVQSHRLNYENGEIHLILNMCM